MGRLTFIGSLCALLVGVFASPASAETRIALVVGNTSYTHAPPLDNPKNDARLLADTLQALGFTLVGNGPQLDLDKRAFDNIVRTFGRALQGADVGLFYYAGHGVQVRGSNFLVPVDANSISDADVDLDMLNMDVVLRQMENAHAGLKIVILDACRNNPFGGSRSLAMDRRRDTEPGRLRDTASGLATMRAREGTLISYATQPDGVARDGTDGHSPYTKALAETIREPGLGLFDVFNTVGLKVKKATGEVQVPWVSTSPIDRPFYFVPSATVAAAAQPLAAAGAEERAWNLVKGSTNFKDFTGFVAQFPNGRHAGDAAARAQEINRAESQKVAALGPVRRAIAPTPVAALTPGRERALKPQESFKECDNCPEMVTIPSGSFTMGSPAAEPQRESVEGPQQRVSFARMFAVGRSEVSFEEWDACVADGGCNAYRADDFRWGRGKFPVINVSWTDAKAYVKWLSQKTGAAYRLLSEAEWEYAARGCTATDCSSTPFSFGPKLSPPQANFDWHFSYNGSAKGLPPGRTVAIDDADPNPFGLLHVHGNVREWVEDCWNGTLAGMPADGTARAGGDCNRHVVRGGAWSDPPKDLRSAKRSWEVTGERREEVGFRVARSLRE
jgi:formylglycine-generating enzyme required for sulfatase activity